MKKGSVTIFLALVLILVLSFVFSMLEGARVYCLKSKAETVTELCMQSVFGNYHCGIWEDYHLLFLDGTWQEGEFSIEKLAGKVMNEVQKNFLFLSEEESEKFWEFTGLSAIDVEMKNVQLATDSAGSIFRSQVSIQMQLEAAEEVLEELFQIRNDGEVVKEEQEQKENTWQKAWEAMEQAEKKLQEQETQNELLQQVEEVSQQSEECMEKSLNKVRDVNREDLSAQNDTEVENPMEYVKELKRSGILALVIEDTSKISTKAVEEGTFLMDRELQTGSGMQQEENVMERFWLQYYIQNYFSNYVIPSTKGAKEKVLDYEWEYMLVGKNSDSENLEEVVKKVLGIREVMNFTTLMQDAEKKALALHIATTTVGFTGMLPLIKAVQAGVLLAWAFVESVLDVRTLLEGKKVPVLKQVNQWKSDLTNCRKSIQEKEQSAEDENGWNYQRYLQMLLFFQSEENISYRCMDLIERNEQVQMDTMIQGVTCVFTYQAKPLFWSLNTVVEKKLEYFEFSVEKVFSY